MTLLHWTLPLPAGYRRDDVIAFHGRDEEGVAEQVTATGLRKGILLRGSAVVLDVAFTDDAALPVCSMPSEAATSAAPRG